MLPVAEFVDFADLKAEYTIHASARHICHDHHPLGSDEPVHKLARLSLKNAPQHAQTSIMTPELPAHTVKKRDEKES